MANHDQTFAPSGRKIARARQQAQVIKSPELQTALILGGGTLALKLLSPWMYAQLLERWGGALSRVGQQALNAGDVVHLFMSWLSWAAVLLAPLCLTMSALAVLVPVLIQGGFVHSTEQLFPKLDRLNPMNGVRRLFSARIGFQLVRDIVKIVLIAFVCYFGVRDAVRAIIFEADLGLAATVARVGGAALAIVLKAVLVLLCLGLLDYAVQKRQYLQELRMTKREIKDEGKETEGDPLIKGRLRRAQRDLLRRRMLLAVPRADVVLTNPTHLAVALKYDAESMDAPRVVAKGQRKVAERIKELARAHGVPVVEDKPLAQALFRLADVGSAIPVQLYRAVAEVLSYVYRLRGKRSPLATGAPL